MPVTLQSMSSLPSKEMLFGYAVSLPEKMLFLSSLVIKAMSGIHGGSEDNLYN